MTATEEQWTVLAQYANEALDGQPADIGEYLRGQLLADRFRVLSRFDLDDDGKPDPGSLAYQVDVRVRDQWVPLVRVHWTRLPGIGSAEVEQELANYRAQQEMGISVEAWAGERPV